MYSHVSTLKTLFTLRDALMTLVTQVDTQQQEATAKGQELYNLGEFIQSSSYLTIGAVKGDRDAQYALAEVMRRKDKEGKVSDDAKHWYQLAGAQGHVYALMRLGDADSLKKARELAQASADKGEAAGMLALYELTQDLSWLKKASDAGSAEASYLAAVKYDKDDNLIPDVLARRAMIDGLLKKAVDANFSRALHWYANRRPVSQNLPERRQWVEKRAELNDVNGVLNYGFGLTGYYENEAGVDTEYGFTKDMVKGYGLIWLVVETTRQLSRHTEARAYLSDLEQEMTPVQIEAAKASADQWKLAHGPMSEFRLSYNDVD